MAVLRLPREGVEILCRFYQLKAPIGPGPSSGPTGPCGPGALDGQSEWPGHNTPAVTHVSVGPPSQSLSVQAQGSWRAGGPRWPQCAEGLLLVSEELGHWWQVARALAFSSEAGGELHLGTCPSQLQALWVAGQGLSLVWVQRTSQHSAWTPWASRAECRARLATCGLQHRVQEPHGCDTAVARGWDSQWTHTGKEVL